jgi:hypothetical protein
MASLRTINPVRCRGTILGLLSFAAACGDGGAPSSGFFTGNWNGQQWVGEAAAVLVSTAGSDTLHIGASRHRRAIEDPEESVLLKVRFSGPGEYPLSGDAVWFTVLVGGDVVVASYTGVSPDAGDVEGRHLRSRGGYGWRHRCFRGSQQRELSALRVSRPVLGGSL